MARPPLLTRPFVLCFIANLVQGIAFNLFLHFPGFLRDLGALPAQIGWISSITALTAIAVRPKVGDAMDRRGRVPVAHFGNVLHVAVIGLYLTVDSVGIDLYAIRVVHGLAEALLFTAFFTLAADQVPEERLTEGLALFGVSGMLPISVGGLLGDFILAEGGYDGLFLTALGFAVVGALATLPLRDAPRQREAGVEGEPQGFSATLLQRDLVPLWWIATIFSIALAAMFIFVKLFVEETGISTVGVFFSAYTAIALGLRIFLGWLPDRVGRKAVLLPALTAQAAGFLSLALATQEWHVVAAGLLCGLGHGFAFPILFSMVVTRAREADRGSAMAIYTGLLDVGVLIGGPALGLVIEAAGFPPMFAAAAGLILFGTASFAIWDRRRA